MSAATSLQVAATPSSRHHRQGGRVSSHGTPGRSAVFFAFATAVLLHSTGAFLSVLQGPVGLIENALWLMVYAVSIAMLADDLVRRRLSLSWHGWTVAYLALAFASVMWSVAPVASLISAIHLTGTVAFAFLLAQRLTPVDILRAVHWAMAVVAVSSVVLFFLGDARVIDEVHGSLRGVLVHKNTLGLSMTIGLLSTGLLLSLDQRRRVRRLLLALPMGLALGLTDSAFGVLLTVTGLLVLAVVHVCSRSRLLLPTLVSLLLALLAGGWLLGVTVQPEEVTAAVGRDATLTGRTEVWPELLAAAAQRPVLGYGHGAFWESSVVNDIRLRLEFPVAHAHNGWLDLVLEAGLLGALLVVALLGSLVVRARRRLAQGHRDVAALALFVLLLVLAMNTVESGLMSEKSILTILTIAAGALLQSGHHQPEAAKGGTVAASIDGGWD